MGPELSFFIIFGFFMILLIYITILSIFGDYFM